MKANELRQKYLKFFIEKGHKIIPPASLIPENDPSVLFTTAGMHPLVPFLLGEKHASGKRLASMQKCIRTGDIDEVGDNTHLTFFEMLGNWSFGEYWKNDTIRWSWEFLTDGKWLGLDKNKLAVTIFAGNDDCPFDDESYSIWRSLGMPDQRIIRLGKEDNWWPAGGEKCGPQGPDTEIFYWTGNNTPPATYNPSEKLWVEIWNNVFMQYNRTRQNGKYVPLAQKNVDTGMGLERTVAALQGKASVYETELFSPILDYIKTMAKNYSEQSSRIIADHLKAVIFIMADDLNIIPSNLRHGYVARKLIRRAARHGKKIGIEEQEKLVHKIADILEKQYGDIYTEVKKNKNKVIADIINEVKCFEKTLENGLREFQKLSLDKKISGTDAFALFSTFGFPFEMINDLAKEQNIKFDESGFLDEEKKHQELSRTASAGMFKGGMSNYSEQAIKYHTATHLLHQALKEALGEHVSQKGSNITSERLRFDFSHPDKMTPKQIKQVEDIVNQKIMEDLYVHFEEMTVNEAISMGAVGLFCDKYGGKVKVYSIGRPSTTNGRFNPPFSLEICGGPHVKHLGVLGKFKIIKEESCSAGIRRIKAILENS